MRIMIAAAVFAALLPRAPQEKAVAQEEATYEIRLEYSGV